MPIYYKKVNPDSADLNLVESGIGTMNGNSSGNGSGSNGPSIIGSTLAGVQKKLSSFAGSRTSLFNNATEVELEKITTSFVDEDHEDMGRTCLESKSADRDRISTKFGSVVVVKQFPTTVSHSSTTDSADSATSTTAPDLKLLTPPRPVIITYHDIGLNYFSNFESFFTRMYIRQLLQDFRIYHINAPGQEEHADDLAHSNYQYPTMDDLAEQVGEVCKFYNIQEFIGFGYGAGANILSRFALQNSDMVEALFLINPSATTSTWSEWFYQKMNVRAIYQQLQAQEAPQGSPLTETPGVLPVSVQDYFIWHNFGNLTTPDRPIDNDAVQFYRRYLSSACTNRHNLWLFIESYVARTALGISRDDKLNNFRCPVAVMCGDYSPHVDESVKVNARLDPTNSTWMKLGDCSMPLEEQPDKVGEVLRLFLQGLGYTLKKVMRQQKSFLTGKSMPSLYEPPSERLLELRRGTTTGLNEAISALGYNQHDFNS